jgi:hypothetical protein
LADRGVYEAKLAGKNRAIGISPSDTGKIVLIATAGDHVSTYSVKAFCVVNPCGSSKLNAADGRQLEFPAGGKNS